jgi:hypothetical protein
LCGISIIAFMPFFFRFCEIIFKGTVSRDFWLFQWIYMERASYRDPALTFLKFCIVSPLDSMLLKQKNISLPFSFSNRTAACKWI